MDEEEQGYLNDVAAAMNRRGGHASMLAIPSPTATWRRLTEVSWATDFSEAVRQKWGVEIRDIKGNDTDPPDCFGMVDGRQVGIELVELVNRKILEANAATLREGREIGSGIQEFLAAAWTKEIFEEKLGEVLDKKEQSYTRRGCFIDILVVITDENWLNWIDAEGWLKDIRLSPRASIGCAFLLFTHDPRHPNHLPVVELFGDLHQS